MKLSNIEACPEIEHSIIPWLGKTGKMVAYFLERKFVNAGIDLTREQWLVMAGLYHKDGLNQGVVACLTHRDKTSMTRIVQVLERKKLVERKSDKLDRRIKSIFMTRRGRELFEQSIPVMQLALDNMQEGISMDQIKDTIEIIKKIQENIKLSIDI